METIMMTMDKGGISMTNPWCLNLMVVLISK